MFKHIRYAPNVYYCVWAQETAIVDRWHYSDAVGNYFVCEHCRTGIVTKGKSNGNTGERPAEARPSGNVDHNGNADRHEQTGNGSARYRLEVL